MDEVSSVGAGSAYAAQAQSVIRVLEQALQMQQESMETLLQSMGLGQRIDIEA